MNIVGEYANYINSILVQFAPANADDVRGIINNGTLYFLVNFGMLYEIDLPNIPTDLCCAFYRTNEVPGSFAQEGVIKDMPEFFNDVANRIMVISYVYTSPMVYMDDDFTTDSQFDKVQNMRPSDGCIKVDIRTSLNYKSFVTISKKMFKLNKADTLSLQVFQVDPMRLLYKFKIYKKKFNLNINLYLLTIDLH